MALEATIGGNGTLFVGEDKAIKLELIDVSNNPVDMTGMALKFVVAKSDKTDTPIFAITPTVTGIFNATRSVNTQRAVATLSAAQLASIQSKTYRHSWKRTDTGSETVLAYGDFTVEIATQHTA